MFQACIGKIMVKTEGAKVVIIKFKKGDIVEDKIEIDDVGFVHLLDLMMALRCAWSHKIKGR